MHDFIVIGAGIAGASAAYGLAARGRTVMLERESQPGYHSTGRSAALYSQAYGPPQIRALSVGSHGFFTAPPAGFSDHPLLAPRGVLFVGAADRREAVERTVADARALAPTMSVLDGMAAHALVPVLRPDRVACAGHEPDAMDLDVHALHQGFLRGFRARGGQVATDAEVIGLAHGGDGWTVETRAGRWSAPVVVNAAGAWCDVVAGLGGVAPVGLVPKRRTAFVFAPPAGMAVEHWPMVVDVDEQFYFKPDAGRLLGSPADETPVEPQDIQPEEWDIAVAADRIETATTLEIRRIERSWAGLRSFVADKTPVVGFDPAAEGFFWLAGQGGYGIQSAPALGRLAAALAAGDGLPADLADLGVDAALLAPARLR